MQLVAMHHRQFRPDGSRAEPGLVVEPDHVNDKGIAHPMPDRIAIIGRVQILGVRTPVDVNNPEIGARSVFIEEGHDLRVLHDLHRVTTTAAERSARHAVRDTVILRIRR